MKLGTEVGLSPGYIVLDADPAPPKKGHIATNFRPISVVAKRMNGSRYHLVVGTEVDLGPVHIVLGSSSP